MDDASPDGTQEVAKQLAKVYGEDHVVCFVHMCSDFRLTPSPADFETESWETRFRVSMIL